MSFNIKFLSSLQEYLKPGLSGIVHQTNTAVLPHLPNDYCSTAPVDDSARHSSATMLPSLNEGGYETRCQNGLGAVNYAFDESNSGENYAENELFNASSTEGFCNNVGHSYAVDFKSESYKGVLKRPGQEQNVSAGSEQSKKRVQFHDCIIKSYHIPDLSHARLFLNVEINQHEILNAYLIACQNYSVAPSLRVEKQIGTWDPRLPRQENFSLRGERMSPGHMEALEEVFKRVQFINVDFEYCFLDDEATIAMADMLEFYDSAIRLNLSFNQLITIRGWQAICRLLRKSPVLEDINLRYTSLTERAIPLLARVLRTESSLVSLHLENCSLSGKGLLILVQAFKNNTSIRELYLAENNMGPNDAPHLYQLISHNTSLHLLDIRNNLLQDIGISHVCDALCYNQAGRVGGISTLVLWNNRLGIGSMPHIARVLRENTTLQTLNLGSNPIRSEGVAQIKDALTRNRSLLRLGLQATKLNCQGAIAIAECVADNPVLVRLDMRDNPDLRLAGLLALHLAMKVKEYSEQFRRIYDEIQDFCLRNRQIYMAERLKAEEEEHKRQEALKLEQEAQETLLEANAAHVTLAKSSSEEEPDLKAEAVRESLDQLLDKVCQNDVIESKPLKVTKKFSLTCPGLLKDEFPERFFEELQQAVGAKRLKDEENLRELGSQRSEEATDKAEAEKPAPFRPRSLRFSISPVSSAGNTPIAQVGFERRKTFAVAPIEDSGSSTPLPVPCFPPHLGVEDDVRLLVSDLVNFCVFETDELRIFGRHDFRSVPSFSPSPLSPHEQTGLAKDNRTVRQPSETGKGLERSKKPLKDLEGKTEAAVVKVLNDLVNFVVYDCDREV